MQEGWRGDDHLILFDEGEMDAAGDRYAIASLLPGYRVLGLRGWDDFIVQDVSGGTYTIPTVPLDTKYLSPFNIPPRETLARDQRFEGKIKWYIKPIAFGGDPLSEENMTWVDHRKHAELVRWWNNLYHSVKKPKKPM